MSYANTTTAYFVHDTSIVLVSELCLPKNSCLMIQFFRLVSVGDTSLEALSEGSQGVLEA